MESRKEYINLIRYSCILDSFTRYYFIRVIVLYLLSNGVTTWIAVSIPIVLEFAAMVTRGVDFAIKFALKVNYKKYHIFYIILTLVLGLIISQCRSIYLIYILTLIYGVLTGIKNSTITKINTSNKEYEPYCFIEEERSQVIGGTLGLIVSQFIYDINPFLYILGYLGLIVLFTIFNLSLENIEIVDDMLPLDNERELSKKEKNNLVLITTFFGILAGLWCMGLSGFAELSPIISNKIGYLESIYTILEIILLCIISGSIIQKIQKKKKLLLFETIVACIDVFCLFIAAVTLSWKGLAVAYIITAFTSTIGDPLWGSIMSAYSNGEREKWVLINKVYFIVRTIFTLISWYVCRECVIKGVETFKYLSIILIILMIVIYIISNKINKRIFGNSI